MQQNPSSYMRYSDLPEKMTMQRGTTHTCLLFSQCIWRFFYSVQAPSFPVPIQENDLFVFFIIKCGFSGQFYNFYNKKNVAVQSLLTILWLLRTYFLKITQIYLAIQFPNPTYLMLATPLFMMLRYPTLSLFAALSMNTDFQ